MSGIKGGSCGQNVQCQDTSKNTCNDPCQKVPASVDPCKTGNQGSHHHHHHHHGHHGHHQKQDAGNPCCPDPCQDKGTNPCSK